MVLGDLKRGFVGVLRTAAWIVAGIVGICLIKLLWAVLIIPYAALYWLLTQI